MSKSKSKTQVKAPSTTVTVNTVARNPRRPGRGTSLKKLPPWYYCAVDPFSSPPTSIPDEFTSPTVKLTSRYTQTVTARDNAGTPGTLHGFCLIQSPNPSKPLDFSGYDSSNFSFNNWADQLANAGVPNLSAAFPQNASLGVYTSGYSYRCIGMGLRVFYEGTELNRAGEYTFGNMAISAQSTSIGTGYLNNQSIPCVQAFATAAADSSYANINATLPNLAKIDARAKRVVNQRICDGGIEVVSAPNGVPGFLGMNGETPAGMVNSNAMPLNFVCVVGDVTSTASGIGNLYGIEAVWHWELIPQSLEVMATFPTPSPSDPLGLAAALNALEASTFCKAYTSPSFSATGSMPSSLRLPMGLVPSQDSGGGYMDYLRSAGSYLGGPGSSYAQAAMAALAGYNARRFIRNRMPRNLLLTAG